MGVGSWRCNYVAAVASLVGGEFRALLVKEAKKDRRS